jgi:hypothetical protein
MSADLPSSNPFRRKAPASTTPSAPPTNPSIVNHIAYQQADPLPGSASLEKLDAPKKITKKVRVQSPPPPSPSTPSLPDSSSTIGEEFYSISAKPPTPIPRDDDPFDSIESDVSEDEEPSILNKAPANPFSKTLETMEHSVRDGPVIVPPNVSSPGRASMDVEAFKRLLMTGSAGLGTSTSSSAAQAHIAHHALGDGGSSTDTSSLSRQSIFEAIQEPHPESPRTSHEISEPEDDRSAATAEFLSSTAGRKKPPPPSSRHGKLIKVELKDDSIPKPLQSPPTPGSFTSQQYFTSSHRSQTDLNKPLPPAPRASHEADRESIFDKEAAGKTPEPPSPSSSIRRKTAPPPPLTRRHSQLVSESKLTRSNTTGRLSPKVEEDISIRRKENNRPPPTRRPTSIIRGFSHNSPLTSPSTVSLPPPPPARGSSRSISGRPPSVHSMDISSNNNKRGSMFPPPPPPHRHARTSMEAQPADASRRPSGEQSRRSIESARRGSAALSMLEAERAGGISGGHDILADLSALQREIDALRTQSEKQKVT